MKVSCDICKEEFEIKQQIEKVKNDVRRVYFIYPKCGYKYIAYYLNSKIEKLQEKSRKLYIKMTDINLTKKKYNEYFKKRKDVIEQTGKEMKRLKSLYGGNEINEENKI